MRRIITYTLILAMLTGSMETFGATRQSVDNGSTEVTVNEGVAAFAEEQEILKIVGATEITITTEEPVTEPQTTEEAEKPTTEQQTTAKIENSTTQPQTTGKVEELTTQPQTSEKIEETTTTPKTTCKLEEPTTKKKNKKVGVIVNKNDKKYSYKDMKRDIKKLTAAYGDRLKSEVVGKTADKRNLYCLTLGNPKAKKSIYVETTTHAREWKNTQFMMAVIEEYCKKYDKGTYDGKKYRDIFNKVNLVIMPMVNPDGVSISQYGLKGIRNKKLRAQVKKVAKGNYKTWKANARCVDINKNFAEGFGYRSTKGKASSGYSGKKAASEAETKAQIAVVEKVNPVAVICYHEAGEVIYYRNNSKLVKTVKKLTGYTLIKEGPTEYGTFSDYLDRKGITNCTPETGLVPAPVSHKQFKKIYKKNKNVLVAAAKLYMKKK